MGPVSLYHFQLRMFGVRGLVSVVCCDECLRKLRYTATRFDMPTKSTSAFEVAGTFGANKLWRFFINSSYLLDGTIFLVFD